MTRPATPFVASGSSAPCPRSGYPPLIAAPTAGQNPDVRFTAFTGLGRARLAMGALAALLFATATAGVPPQMESSVVAGGGGHSESERFTLEGTAGQTASALLTGQHFTISGGFWQSPSVAPVDTIFSNGFED